MAKLRGLHDEAVEGREWMKERLYLAEMKAAEFGAVHEEDSRNLLTLQGQNEELRKNVASLERTVQSCNDDNEELMSLYTVALEGRERVKERLYIAEMEAAEYAVLNEEDASDLIELQAQKENLESRIQLLMNENEELTDLYTAVLEERQIIKDKLHDAEMRTAVASQEASRQLFSCEALIQQLLSQNEEKGREIDRLKNLEKGKMICLYNAEKQVAKYAVEREEASKRLLSAEWEIKRLNFSLNDALKQLDDRERDLKTFTVQNSQLETALSCAIQKGKEKDSAFATQTRQLEYSLECALSKLKQKQHECDELKELQGLREVALLGDEIEMVKVNGRVGLHNVQELSAQGCVRFDLVADENAPQDHFFQVIGLPLSQQCMGGYNSAIFAFVKNVEDAEEGTCVKYLKDVEVSNTVDVLPQLVQGAANKKVATMNDNHVSSRSHTMFTCNVNSECKSQGSSAHHRSDQLHLVDMGWFIDDSHYFSLCYFHSLKNLRYANKSLSTFSYSKEKCCIRELDEEVVHARNESKGEKVEEPVTKTPRENEIQGAMALPKTVGNVKSMVEKLEQQVQRSREGKGNLLPKAKRSNKIESTVLFSNPMPQEAKATFDLNEQKQSRFAQVRELDRETEICGKGFLHPQTLVGGLQNSDAQNIEMFVVQVVNKLEEILNKHGQNENQEVKEVSKFIGQSKSTVGNIIKQPVQKSDEENLQKVVVYIMDKLEEQLTKNGPSKNEEVKPISKINGKSNIEVEHQELQKSNQENEQLMLRLHQLGTLDNITSLSSTSLPRKVETPSQNNEVKSLRHAQHQMSNSSLVPRRESENIKLEGGRGISGVVGNGIRPRENHLSNTRKPQGNGRSRYSDRKKSHQCNLSNRKLWLV